MNIKLDGQCGTCNHYKHDAGRCKNCNCGESEMIRGMYGDGHHRHDEDYSTRITGIYQTRPTVMGERHYNYQKKKK